MKKNHYPKKHQQSNKKGRKPDLPNSQLAQQNARHPLALYVTVMLTGAAVMMLELLGTRIIGPFYGVSLVVWSALISVTLIALALGYYLGGLSADIAKKLYLSQIIALSAFFTAVIPVFSQPVLAMTDSLGLRIGAFTSAVILFTVPLTLLAMVGPLVIKLSAERFEKVGRATGSIYAVSTLGSVIGTLVLGFILLPYVGVKTVIYSVSIVLFLLATLLAVSEYSGQAKTAPVATSLGLAMIAALVNIGVVQQAPKSNDQFNVLYQSENMYGWVRVVDESQANIRWMLSDSSTISAAAIDTGKSLLGYQRIDDLLPFFNSQGKHALLIGLGGGQISTTLKMFDITTDVIEINPDVVTAAKDYYGFRPTGDLIVGDARYRVRRLNKKYDFIIHDCFTGGSEPTYLLTIEMLQTLRSLLKPKGILVVNFVGFRQGDKHHVTAAIYRTLSRLFRYQRTFVSEPGSDFNDFVFLASDKPLALEVNEHGKKLVEWLSQHEQTFHTGGSWLISDNLNPLDYLEIRKAETYRKLLISRIGTDLLLR